MQDAYRHTPGIRRLLVLGGSGFIGRHAVAAAARSGIEPVIGTRDPRPRHLRAAAVADFDAREVHLERHARDGVPPALLDDVDAVLNCVGILRQRGKQTYRAIHHYAVAAWANACAARALPFVHVSALGLDAPVASRFLTCKRDGERALMASGADWRLVRPALLDGPDGFGSSWMRRVARWPLHLYPSHARGRLAPFHVDDLGTCLVRIATRPIAPDATQAERVFELGGHAYLTIADLLAALRAADGRTPATRIAVPAWICRAAAHAFDVFHLTPYSYGHHELLGRDNLPAHNRTGELLGRPPLPLGIDPSPAARPPAPVPQRLS
jgi:NADH dehydrogenase